MQITEEGSCYFRHEFSPVLSQHPDETIYLYLTMQAKANIRGAVGDISIRYYTR
jgi:hypothetical protein